MKTEFSVYSVGILLPHYILHFSKGSRMRNVLLSALTVMATLPALAFAGENIDAAKLGELLSKSTIACTTSVTSNHFDPSTSKPRVSDRYVFLALETEGQRISQYPSNGGITVRVEAEVQPARAGNMRMEPSFSASRVDTFVLSQDLSTIIAATSDESSENHVIDSGNSVTFFNTVHTTCR